MRRVITYGTFDLLHYGHINLLKRAKQQGDYLIVALSTDEFNWNSKRKKSYFSYEVRKEMLEAIRYVDMVIPEENWEQKKTDVEKYDIDVFVMGNDWEGLVLVPGEQHIIESRSSWCTSEYRPVTTMYWREVFP